ncbi:ATP synthase mitochondrial F1 complex assembly factor 2 isoform X1 [Hydra vulgaris]|uniref:ATP synthase mitochondrial F1 complex assembly factor 2 n=1 Tax=Hydra vulgaris TaxID=6087 RepID=T2MA33_HYDVU|nr:ATP synthase mitochondrial F1 complex assembly factor 2 [Hydra vulgaris]
MDVLKSKFICQVVAKRFTSYLRAHKKRFYKEVTLKPVQDGFLIQLDKRTIKTPLGKPLLVPCEPLGIAVANEWHMQDSDINTSVMPLTVICNTAIDNPCSITKSDLVNGMLRYFQTDTICALADQPEELVELQAREWVPIINWFSKWHGISVVSTSSLFELKQPDLSISKLKDHLMNLNRWQIYGLQSAMEITKSFILPMVVSQKYISVEKAVYLSRLEVEHQITKWGNVEFAHELEKQNQTIFLAAGILFYHFTAGIHDSFEWNNKIS